MQPTRRFALAGLSFNSSQKSRMKRNARSDELVLTQAPLQQKVVQCTGKAMDEKGKEIIGSSSNEGLQQRGGRRDSDSRLKRRRSRSRSSSSGSMLQQRGGRQYDSSLVGAPPPPLPTFYQ